MKGDKISKMFSEYSKYLIVDENGKAMAFDQEQLCYCDVEGWEDICWPAQVYSLEEAKKHIKATNKFRKRHKFEVGIYKLIPFYL